MAKGIQAKSADALVIENRLRNTTPGDVVTYAELSTLLGRDVREHCIGAVHTARKALVNESVFFDTISNEGYKRLNHDEACKASSHYVVRSKNAANRGLKHLANVKFAELSDECKKEHLTTSAQLGAVKMFSSPAATKKIGAKVTDANAAVLPIGETLRLFGG